MHVLFSASIRFAAMVCVQRRLTSLQHEFLSEFGIRCWRNDRLMQRNTSEVSTVGAKK